MKNIKGFDSYFKSINEDTQSEYNENEINDESDVYIGDKMMKELATKLGVEIINNHIEYDGNIINYYSETEKFHIGNKKFDDVESIYDFLTSK